MPPSPKRQLEQGHPPCYFWQLWQRQDTSTRTTEHTNFPHYVFAITLGVLLIYSTLGLPGYGDPSAPAHQHLAHYFLTQTPVEIGVPNVVTAILASYRGFDTLGELLIIFTAGIAIVGIFSANRKT